MSSRSALPSSKKTHSEQHKLILKQLLREAPNKVCVDCKTAKNPRWASWNLGCFICIRCSGIHRSMGTHISKVKSVDLDAWTDEQIENMVRWGNEKCNLYWEGSLPEGYVPNELKIENFIRTKYEMAKWKGSAPPKPTASVPAASHSSTASSHSHANAANSHIHKPAVPNKSHHTKPAPAEDLLSFSNAPKSSHPPAKPAKTNLSSNSLLDDDFGSFTSSPSPSNAAKSPPIQSAQSTGGSVASNGLNGRPDLKKSILSLYSSPSSSSNFIPQQPRNCLNGNSGNHVNNLSNSLNGLNFGQPQQQAQYQSPSQGYTQPSQSQSQPSFQPQGSFASNFNSTFSSNNTSTIAQNGSDSPSPSLNKPKPSSNNSWNNEWNDSGASLPNKWNGNNNSSGAVNVGLDDDLFKNVWN